MTPLEKMKKEWEEAHRRPEVKREDVVAKLAKAGYDPEVGKENYERLIKAYLHVANGTPVRASKVVRCRHCGRILPRAYMNHFTLCAHCRFARKSAVKKGVAK